MKTKKIVLFDIDNTVYDGFIIFSLAEYQLNEGIINQNCLDKLFKDLEFYTTGRKNYETTITNLLIHWAMGLKGSPYNRVLEQTRQFLSDKRNKFFSFVQPVISILEKTHDIYFVTGEPQFVGLVVCDKYQTKGHFSSELEVRDGIFTGKIKRPLAKRQEKQKVINWLLKNYSTKGSFAFGDSEGDIEMLSLVENPLCVNPTPNLQLMAKKNGWQIAEPEKVENIVRNIQLQQTF